MEVLGRYSNHVDQGERLQGLLGTVPEGSDGPRTRTRKRVFRRLTPDQIDQLIASYKTGIPAAQIAANLGVDQSTVHKYVGRRGLHDRGRRFGDLDIAVIVQLYEGGKSTVAIGEQFDAWPATVAYQLKKVGLRSRKRRGYCSICRRRRGITLSTRRLPFSVRSRRTSRWSPPGRRLEMSRVRQVDCKDESQ